MNASIRVRRVVPAEWKAYRELRLRGLESDPTAFGSALQTELG